MKTIEYYNENGIDCYLLDASKAFNRVEYVNIINIIIRCAIEIFGLLFYESL